MWENSLEKLKVLNYEINFCKATGRKPFSRVHFVLPSKNLATQFDDFIEVCAWLCTQITKDPVFFKRDQFDDPNTVANKLMLALRQLDFRLSFPAQKLKSANGEAVCSVLDFLTDKTLAGMKFEWGHPDYDKQDNVSYSLN